MNNIPRNVCNIGSRTETFAERRKYVNNPRLCQRSKRRCRMPVRKEGNGRELTLQQNTNALGGKCSLILNKCKKTVVL